VNNIKGIFLAVLSAAAFGIMPIFAKLSYIYGSNPTSALLFRFLFATIILFTYFKISNINYKVTLNQFILLFCIGSIGYTTTTQTLFISYNYLDVGLATTLHYIYPSIVCILSFFIYREKISRKKILSLILSALGVYSLVAFENTSINVLGTILALISGVSYAINVICFSMKSIKDLDTKVVTLYVSIGATFGMVIYGMFTNTITLNFNTQIFLSYIGLSVVSTIFSIVLLLKAIQLIGSSSASILGTFEAIISIILGILLLNEKLTFPLIIGSILIVISAILIAKDKSNSYETHKLAPVNEIV